MVLGEEFELYEAESYGGADFERTMKSLSESMLQIEKTCGYVAMPVFDGTNPSGWISEVERFFIHGRYAYEAKLDLVFFSLEGVAYTWFLRAMSTLMDWTTFKHKLLAQFDPEIDPSSEKKLMSDHVSPQIEES